MRESICLALTGLMWIAVSDGPRQTPPQGPIFRSSTEMVEVDVSVLDKDHRPVRGLTQADFTVLEDGKPQPIAAFAATDIPDAIPPTAPWMRTAPVDLVTNQVQDSRLFVLVLDDALIELDLASINSVKRVAKTVVDRLGSGDRMAVVFTRDNRRAQDFTNDHERLFAAIDAFSVGFPSGIPLYFDFMLTTLGEVGKYLADVPERRKVLIYVGPGMSLDLNASAPMAVAPKGGITVDSPSMADRESQLGYSVKVKQIFDNAQRANVNIYTIDACGLRGVKRPGPASPMLVPQTCKTGGYEVDFLRGLALATGGRATVATSDFNPGIDQIFRENGSYYLLGYRPVDVQADGRFHRIQVRVNRPGLEVRARTGYYAPDAKAIVQAKAKGSGGGLDEGLAGVVPKTDLPMVVSLAPFATSDHKTAILATIGIASAGLQAPTSSPVAEIVDLQSSVFTPEGSARGSHSLNAKLMLMPDTGGRWHYDMLTAIDVPPGRYSLRFAAHSQAANKTGSVYADVIVPDFTQERVSISGVVLTKAPAPPKVSNEDVAALLPVTPTSERLFAATDRVAAFLRVYEGGNNPAAPANVSVRIQDGTDKTVFSRVDVLSAGTFTAAARVADYQFSLPIDSLKTGSFLLSIQVKVGNQTRTRDVRFDVK